MQTSPHRQHHRKPAHLRAAPCPAPKPTAAQDPTPEQQAAWKRLHGYAGMPLPEPVESYLQAEAAQAKTHHAPPADPKPVDLWPVITRIYTGLALVGLVAVVAVVWGA